MTGLDIETAVRNKIALLTVVFNNQVMARNGLPSDSKEKFGLLAVGGNYAKLAELLMFLQSVYKAGRHTSGGKGTLLCDRSGLLFLLDSS